MSSNLNDIILSKIREGITTFEALLLSTGLPPIQIMAALASLTKHGWIRQVITDDNTVCFELSNNISVTYHPRGLVTLTSGVKRSTITMGQEEGGISLTSYIRHKNRVPEPPNNDSWTSDDSKDS